MKSPYQIVVLLCAALGQFPHYNHAQIYPSIEEEVLFQIDTVTSSSFELALYSTPTKLDDGAIENLQKMIKNALLMASSSSSDFVSLEAIEILVEVLEFKQDYVLKETSAFSVRASLLQFKVKTYFDLKDTTSSPPSRFAVDNLIVRTFSQPSTKSRFVGRITLTGDPFLIDVENIGINLVDDKLNERVVDGEAAQLSKVDVILISASSFILIGVFLVFIAHCQKEGYEDIQEQKSFKAKNRPVKTDDNNNRVNETDSNGPNNDVEKDQISLARMMSVEGNIVETGSLESSIDSQSLMLISVQNKTPAVSFASSSSSNFTSGSRSSASSSSASESSASSSSASKSSASTCTSLREDYADASLETSRGEQGDSTIDSESMGSKKHNYDSTIALTKATSALASKLLSLPRTNTNVLRKKFGSAYSLSVSAPTILEETETTRHQFKNNESKTDDKSIKSARSAASSESFELNDKKRNNTSDPILSRSVPKNQVLLNGLVMLESTREFHKSWLESKRKALEDIEEEGAVDDVFHIDVQRSGIFLEEAETMKSTSTWRPTSVSEWMKSIRVINSASDTQSSVEHSSTGDPKSSHHARENSSLDLSLEDSLATSMG